MSDIPFIENFLSEFYPSILDSKLYKKRSIGIIYKIIVKLKLDRKSKKTSKLYGYYTLI